MGQAEIVRPSARAEPGRRGKSRDGRAKAILADVVTHAILTFFALVAFGALVWMYLASLKSAQEILRIPPTFLPENPSIDNFILILREHAFARYFLNSVLVAVPVVASVLFTSSLVGFVFAKFEFPAKEAMFTAILSTMMIPAAVTLLPLFQLVSQLGWADTYQALILPVAISAFGIFLMRQFIEGVPSELMDAGRIDGASNWWIYARIIVPLSTSALSALAIFTYLANWDSYLWPLVIIYKGEMRTLPLGLSYLMGWSTRPRFDLFLTGAVITVTPTIIFYSFFQRRFVRGVAVTGLKL